MAGKLREIPLLIERFGPFVEAIQDDGDESESLAGRIRLGRRGILVTTFNAQCWRLLGGRAFEEAA